MRFAAALIALFIPTLTWANCEDKLAHNLTRGTLHLLEQRVIGEAEIIEMVNSDVPVNPVRNRTFGSRDSAAGHFFRNMLASNMSQVMWQQIRAELAPALARFFENSAVVEVARDATAELPTFKLVNRADSPQGESWAATKYMYLDNATKEMVVKSAVDGKELWRGCHDENSHYLLRREEGALKVVKLSELSSSVSELVLNLFRQKIVKESIDVATGEIKTTEHRYIGRGFRDRPAEMADLVSERENWYTQKLVTKEGKGEASLNRYWVSVLKNGKWKNVDEKPTSFYVPHYRQSYVVDYAILANGGLAMAGYEGTNVGWRLRRNEIQFATPGSGRKMVYTAGEYLRKVEVNEFDGRVLVMATSCGRNGQFFQIFAPLESEHPILTHEFHAFGDDARFAAFERDGEFYVVAINPSGINPVREGHAVYYQPFRQSTPLVTQEVGDFSTFRVAFVGDRPYMILDGGSGGLLTYALFGRPD